MISLKAQRRIGEEEWDEALRTLASLGVNVDFYVRDLTEDRKPAIVSLSKALLALKERHPEAWKNLDR